MANDSTQVAVGKPKVTGAIWIAPSGTTLPTDATTALNAAFQDFGYVSEDGVTIAEERDSEDITAWGGDTVYSVQTSYKETVAFTPIEINPVVAKAQYGDANVEVTDGKMTVKHTGSEVGEKPLVIETVPNARTVCRMVAPRAKLSEKGDLTLGTSDPMGRETTFTCLPDASGVTVYEYMAITGLSAGGTEKAAKVAKMTVSELDAYAAENGVDLAGAKTKGEKVAAIVAAEAKDE